MAFEQLLIQILRNQLTMLQGELDIMSKHEDRYTASQRLEHSTRIQQTGALLNAIDPPHPWL